jgi:hypothetical protein
VLYERIYKKWIIHDQALRSTVPRMIEPYLLVLLPQRTTYSLSGAACNEGACFRSDFLNLCNLGHGQIVYAAKVLAAFV